MNDWNERRKENNNNVEMGEISRSDLGRCQYRLG